MTLNNQISRSPTRRGREPTCSSRDRLSRVERGSLQVAVAAVASFGVYGIATGSPSTVGYVSSVIAIGATIAWLRQAVLPGLLATGLAIAAIATLAGGLI